MDESSLSTLASLQTFTHTDVVKGVTSPIKNASIKGDSYLVQVMRMLGKEVRAISELEWDQLDSQESSSVRAESPQPLVVGNEAWKQHLAPQDDSLPSRKIRRRGCLSFFRELFNMVRVSLQQSDKDDFYVAIVCMEVELDPLEEDDTDASKEDAHIDIAQKMGKDFETINLLSLLAAVLADPTADVTEKGSILEIIGAIAMHDPSHIRRHSLEYHEILKRNVGIKDGEAAAAHGRPAPNERRQIVFNCPPNDVIASLLFLLAIETDAGLLLQTTEIMRIILDTDMLGDHGPMGAGLNAEENEGVSLDSQANSNLGKSNGSSGVPVATHESDQNQFLSLFYEHFVQWLVAPFQFTIVHPPRRLPDSALLPKKSVLFDTMMDVFKHGVTKGDSLLKTVEPCAIRGSFAVELLSFCVRAHLYRMKFFLLRSRVLGSILKLLHPNSWSSSGDRCLKLAALRLLRSILSVKDEFYHRHIIQHNLFAPVFETFRANPVGDNLVSSAIVEMCDFIQNQNIKSLIEYIVTKHLVSDVGSNEKSLEDVATPYVSTLTTLRKVYEENLNSTNNVHTSTGRLEPQESNGTNNGLTDHARYFSNTLVRSSTTLSEKALEDQVS